MDVNQPIYNFKCIKFDLLKVSLLISLNIFYNSKYISRNNKILKKVLHYPRVIKSILIFRLYFVKITPPETCNFFNVLLFILFVFSCYYIIFENIKKIQLLIK